MTKMDWEKARKRDSVRGAAPKQKLKGLVGTAMSMEKKGKPGPGKASGTPGGWLPVNQREGYVYTTKRLNPLPVKIVNSHTIERGRYGIRRGDESTGNS